MFAKMVTKGELTNPDREFVPAGTMAGHIPASVGRHPAGTADRRLHIGIGEFHTPLCHPVEIGGVERFVPGAAQIVEPQLVIHDEKNVLLVHVVPFPG